MSQYPIDLIEHNNKLSRRRFLTIAGVSALALSSLGGSLAYFTGTDEKKNELSVAKNLNVEIVEPNWDPENGKNVVPMETINKDPRVKNITKEYSGYLYIEVRIPYPNIITHDVATGNNIGPEKTELFTYETSSDWVQIQEFEDNEWYVRRYAYPEIVQGGEETTPIFEEVTVANLINKEGITNTNIDIIAYGIQSEGFSNYQDAWIAYKNQNGIKDGNVRDEGDEDPNATTSFAIFSEDDNSLVFYRNNDVLELEEGGTYCGKSITRIYQDIDNTAIEMYSWPWNEYVLQIESVDFRGNVFLNSGSGNCAVFYGHSNLEYVNNIDKLDVSNLTDLSGFFSNCGKLKEINGLEKWDVSNVQDFSMLFNQSSLLTRLNLENWDTSAAKNINYMFYNLFNLVEIKGIENFDTSNCESMSDTFGHCRNLILDLSKWDVSKVTNHSYFANGTSTIIEPAWV